MPRTGRPPNKIPPRKINLNLPADVLDFLDTMTLDPVRGVPHKGARSAVLAELVRSLRTAYMLGEDAINFAPALRVLRKYATGGTRT